jgi:hypoxanthine phosphoribosyltransferase
MSYIPKTYLTANDVTRDSFLLAHEVFISGFRPEAVIALWRGGTPVGIVVQEYLQARGIICYHTAVKITSYTGIGAHSPPVLENMDHVRAQLKPGGSVLIVDDIFDSGKTAEAILHLLRPITANIRFAMPYYKPSNNKTRLTPDYFIRETDSWLVFPHELFGLTPDEIRAKDLFIASLLES